MPRIRSQQLPQLLLIVTFSIGIPSMWLLRLGSSSGGGSGRQGCVAVALRALQAAGWSGNPKDSFLTRRSAAVDWSALTLACRSQLPAVVAESASSELPVGEQCFVEKLPRQARIRAMRHLARVAEQLELAGVELYLDMGTALGALRHFEMIPYDEDIDLRIREDQKEAAKAVLSQLRYRWPELLFHDTEWINQHWKVHLRDTLDPVLDRPVAIDIFFYRLNHTSDQVLIREPPFSFPIGDIFPTVRRPFHNRWYGTPNSIGSMISGYFANTSLSDCVYYLHDLPFATCSRPVTPCQSLTARFQFSETIQLAGGQLQLLASSATIHAAAYIAGADRL